MSKSYPTLEMATYLYDKELMLENIEPARTNEIDIIRSWLEAHLGELNMLINTSFAVEGGIISSFGEEEAVILKKLYVIQYYKKQSRVVLREADDASNSLDFEELREGDSVIKRNSKRDQLKDYMALIKEANGSLDVLVSKYNTYQSPPSQIIEKGSYN